MNQTVQDGRYHHYWLVPIPGAFGRQLWTYQIQLRDGSKVSSSGLWDCHEDCIKVAETAGYHRHPDNRGVEK